MSDHRRSPRKKTPSRKKILQSSDELDFTAPFPPALNSPVRRVSDREFEPSTSPLTPPPEGSPLVPKDESTQGKGKGKKRRDLEVEDGGRGKKPKMTPVPEVKSQKVGKVKLRIPETPTEEATQLEKELGAVNPAQSFKTDYSTAQSSAPPRRQSSLKSNATVEVVVPASTVAPPQDPLATASTIPDSSSPKKITLHVAGDSTVPPPQDAWAGLSEPEVVKKGKKGKPVIRDYSSSAGSEVEKTDRVVMSTKPEKVEEAVVKLEAKGGKKVRKIIESPEPESEEKESQPSLQQLPDDGKADESSRAGRERDEVKFTDDVKPSKPTKLDKHLTTAKLSTSKSTSPNMPADRPSPATASPAPAEAAKKSSPKSSRVLPKLTKKPGLVSSTGTPKPASSEGETKPTPPPAGTTKKPPVVVKKPPRTAPLAPTSLLQGTLAALSGIGQTPRVKPEKVGFCSKRLTQLTSGGIGTKGDAGACSERRVGGCMGHVVSLFSPIGYDVRLMSRQG